MSRFLILTRRGVCVAIASLSLVATGIGSGFSDLTRAGLFAGALILGAMALIFFRRMTAQVTRDSGTQTRLRVGQRETIVIEVTTRKRTWLPLELTERHEFEGAPIPTWQHPAFTGGSRTLRYCVTPQHRGFFSSGPLEVRFTDPLSFAQRRTNCGPIHPWLVWPRLVNLEASPALTNGEGDEELPTRHLLANAHAGAMVREYRPGDDIRHVHWSATARQGELMVRQFEPPANDLTRIVLAGDVPVPGADPAWEELVSLAASALLHFTRGGAPVELVLADQTLHSPHEALDALALLGPCATPSPSAPEAATVLLQHSSSPPTLEAPRIARGAAFLHGVHSIKHVEALNQLGWEVYDASANDQAPVDYFREIVMNFGTRR